MVKTPWNKVHHKITVTQLVRNSLPFMELEYSLPSPQKRGLSWTTWLQSTPFTSCFLKMLLSIILPNSLFPSGYLTKTLYALLIPPIKCQKPHSCHSETIFQICCLKFTLYVCVCLTEEKLVWCKNACSMKAVRRVAVVVQVCYIKAFCSCSCCYCVILHTYTATDQPVTVTCTYGYNTYRNYATYYGGFETLIIWTASLGDVWICKTTCNHIKTCSTYGCLCITSPTMLHKQNTTMIVSKQHLGITVHEKAL